MKQVIFFFGGGGGCIIVSSPEETKLLTCSCSNLLEARPWWFSAFCSPLVLQTPNKPVCAIFLGEKRKKEEKNNCILSAKCSDFRWDVYNVDMGFWYRQYAKRFVRYYRKQALFKQCFAVTKKLSIFIFSSLKTRRERLDYFFRLDILFSPL